MSEQAQAVQAIRDIDGPPKARLGAGALNEIGIIASELGIHRALVVVDPALADLPGVDALQVRLAEHSVRPHLADHVTPTPLYADVMAVVEVGKEHRCDGVISFGGGSTIDVAKAASLVLADGGDLADYARHGRVADRTLPHIAVTTTAGTGAESSTYAFLREDHGHEHTILHHPILMPDAVVLDPLAHVSMPPRITAATGLNAMTHAIGAYVSPAATPESDRRALQAITTIRTTLPRVVAEGGDVAARSRMAEASFLAGQAFNEAGLGIIDSISLVLTNLFTMGHSEANAMVLPYALAVPAYADPSRLPAVAEALGASPGDDPAKACVEAIRDLQTRVGQTGSLAKQGLSRDDLYLCAGSILNHPFMHRSGRDLDERALADILVSAIEDS